jgi:hypothetical protein
LQKRLKMWERGGGEEEEGKLHNKTHRSIKILYVYDVEIYFDRNTVYVLINSDVSSTNYS